MKNYRIQQKCKSCLKTFSAEEKQELCEECRKVPLQVNNPKGYNKHKKNKKPKEITLTQESTFAQLEKNKQYEQIQELGNKIWREGKELFKLKKRFNMMNKVYFGFNFKDEED